MGERAVLSRQMPFDGKVFNFKAEERKIPDDLAEECRFLPTEIKKYLPLAIVCSLDLESKSEPVSAGLHFPVEAPIKVYASLGTLVREKTVDKKATIPRGVIFILDPEEFTDLSEQKLRLLRWMVGRKASRRKNSPEQRKFWFVERTEAGDLPFLADDEDEKRWKEFKGRIGLVNFEIGMGRSFSCRQKVEKRGQTDMRKKSYFFPTQEKVIEEYNSFGFRVVSTKEIDVACKASKIVRRDYERLKHGLGVLVEADCGCVTRMGLTGTETVIHNCDGDSCRFKEDETDKKGKESETPIFIGSRLMVDDVCRDCGQPLYVCARKGIKDIRKGQEITWNVFCEKDGLIRDGSFWTAKPVITID